MAIGLILWLAVSATIAGISIQTIGIILVLVGLVWLVIEIASNRRGTAVADGPGYRERVVQEPVVREREVR